MTFRTRRIIKPGKPGINKYVDKYGDNLFCVRYRYDDKTGKRVTTVELVVDEKQPAKRNDLPHNKKVFVEIKYNEHGLRHSIKTFGAKWNKELKLWETNYSTAKILEITDRIQDVNQQKNKE